MFYDSPTLPFAWDRRLDATELRAILHNPHHPEYLDLAALLLREAQPHVVWQYLTPAQVQEILPLLHHKLGRQREFWPWLLQEWRDAGVL